MSTQTLELEQSHQEFTDFTAESFEHLLIYGAAKLASVIPAEAIDYFNTPGKGIPHESERLAEVAPVIGKILRIVGSLGQDATAFDNLNAGGDQDRGVHRDSVGKNGLSILIPVIGDDAVFAAGNKHWSDGHHVDGADYLTTYGLGDLMLVRQYIRTYNSAEINVPQAFHCGISSGRRWLHIIDTNNANISADFTK